MCGVMREAGQAGRIRVVCGSLAWVSPMARRGPYVIFGHGGASGGEQRSSFRR
jgi:hypothetical protein